MISLENFIKIEELENKLFKPILEENNIVCLGNLVSSIDYQIASEEQELYKEYKEFLYSDIVNETLDKTYYFSKLKSEIEKQFNLEYIHDYKFQYPDKPNNNRCYIQANKQIINSEKFQSILDRYGYFVSKKISDNNSIGVYIEPIYFNNLSKDINKCKFLWHIIPCSDNKYLSLENIKQSFKKKGGLKPSKREKISKHFRRTYVWKENQNVEDIWDYIKRCNSTNHFILVKIKLKEYLNHRNDRKIEWYEDPNTRGGIWTREMIPYYYLDFYDLHNKNELINILKNVE